MTLHLSRIVVRGPCDTLKMDAETLGRLQPGPHTLTHSASNREKFELTLKIDNDLMHTCFPEPCCRDVVPVTPGGLGGGYFDCTFEHLSHSTSCTSSFSVKFLRHCSNVDDPWGLHNW